MAIEAVPSCKRTIETASNPLQMWSGLYDELTHFDAQMNVVSADTATSGQIYAFALRCLRDKKPKFLCADVWAFFHCVVGGYIGEIEHLERDLPRLLSVAEFEFWAEALKAMQKFRAASRSAR